jgi:carboxymethylenebutenolidase
MSEASPSLTPHVVQVVTAAGSLPIAEIRLGGIPRGAVVVLCDTGGFNQATEVMNGLAEHGYASIAADLSNCVVANHDPIAAVGGLLTHLADTGWEQEQIGIVGYGRGGWLSLRAGAAFTLGAAVSVAPVQPAGEAQATARALADLRTPWLGMTAEQDTTGIAEALLHLDRMRRERVAVYTEVVHYPGVPERFYRGASESLVHAAKFDSWQRTIEWLNLRVVPPLTPRAHVWRTGLPAAGVP